MEGLLEGLGVMFGLIGIGLFFYLISLVNKD